MTIKTPQPPPGRETPVPDINSGAPRPKTLSDESAAVPDMDHPPQMQGADQPAFDSGTAEEEREARAGTVPGPHDTEAEDKDDPTWDDADSASLRDDRDQDAESRGVNLDVEQDDPDGTPEADPTLPPEDQT